MYFGQKSPKSKILHTRATASKFTLVCGLFGRIPPKHPHLRVTVVQPRFRMCLASLIDEDQAKHLELIVGVT